MLKGWRLASVVSFLGVATFGAGLSLLPMVDDSIRDPQARPAVLDKFGEDAPITSPAEWLSRRAPVLRAAFAQEVYGRLPPSSPVEAEKRPLPMVEHAEYATLEEWTLRFRLGERPAQLRAVAAFPKGAGPFPVIVMEQFCSNRAAFENSPLITPADPLVERPCEGDWIRPIIRSIFGTYIFGPPIKRAVERGYAVVLFQAGEVIPDVEDAALAGLSQIEPASADAPNQPGAVAVWAWTFSRVLDALETDPRFDAGREALWGHSRYGKAALVAAAYDARPDAVVALQSGTGGATLSRSYNGESVGEITESYPHWFAASFARYAGREDALPVDQHQLLALIAPRPILLGAARQDQWSDPKGAFRAAQGADAVYELFGVPGLDQPRMSAFNREAGIAFYLRNGLHGVTTRDWTRTLDFLDAQFAKPRPPAPVPVEPLQPTPVRL